MTGMIDIQKLFDVPDTANEDRTRGTEAVAALGTRGGMSAYLAPQAQRNARAGLGRMLGVDLRSEKEQIQEQLRQLGTPQTEAEHQAYADLLDKLQTGAGLQYQMARAQENRRERQLQVNEGQLAAQEARDEQSRIEGNERMRIAAMTLVRNLDNDKKPQIQRAGDKVVAVSYDENNKPVVEEIYDGTGSLSADKVASLTQAASLQYADNPEGFAAITSNILSGNITDAGDFDDYVTIPDAPERGQMLGTMRTISKKNSDMSNEALTTINRIDLATNRLVAEGLLNEDGSVNESLRAAGGFAGRTLDSFLNFTGQRDEFSKIRTAFSREKNQEIINSLPPGVASDRDISIFAAGFPPDDAPLEEVAEYFAQARYVQKQLIDHARLADAHWAKQMDRGENASNAGLATAWQDFKQATERDYLGQEMTRIDNLGLTPEQTSAEKQQALAEFKEKYGILPYRYR